MASRRFRVQGGRLAPKTCPIVVYRQGATLIVNPLTALAFFDIVKRGSHTAIVNNAAASALGRMIIRLGRRFPLSAAQAAVEAYRMNMTAGKVLLVANS